jgi:hypothetical protein
VVPYPPILSARYETGWGERAIHPLAQAKGLSDPFL